MGGRHETLRLHRLCYLHGEMRNPNIKSVAHISTQMDIEFLGGGEEVGRLGIFAKINGNSMLFDYGLTPGEPPEYPKQSPPVDFVFLSHSHLDHSGMIPWLSRMYDMPVYATIVTQEIRHAEDSGCQRISLSLREEGCEPDAKKLPHRGALADDGDGKYHRELSLLGPHTRLADVRGQGFRDGICMRHKHERDPPAERCKTSQMRDPFP